MSEEVFEIEALRKRVVDVLRKEDRWMTTSELTTAVGAQYWAVDRVLEYAYLGKEAEFVAGAGWRALEQGRQPATANDEGQGVLA